MRKSNVIALVVFFIKIYPKTNVLISDSHSSTTDPMISLILSTMFR